MPGVNRFRVTLLLLAMPALLVAGIASIAHADAAPVSESPIILENRTSPEEQQFQQQLSLARSLMQSQNWQGAEAVLELLYQSQPTNSVVINQLMKCLDELKQYPKAVDLVRREVEREPKNIYLHLRLAEFLVKEDSLKEAMSIYNKAIDEFADGNFSYQQSIVNNLVFYGFPDRAVQLIDSLRGTSGDSTLFALQKGGIFEQKREYEQATYEYYKLLGDTARSAIDAEKKLTSLLEFPTSSESAIKVLKKLADQDQNELLFKMLSDYYLKQQQFEPAFSYAIRRDSSASGTGAGLLTFLRNCHERSLYKETIRMARYIIDRYPDSPILPEAYFLYAEALTEQGSYDTAIAVYDTMYTMFPRMQDKSAALYEIGAIYAEKLNDCDTGCIYFDSVIAGYPAGTGYFDALLARPDCYMRQGLYDKARTDFAALRSRHFDENRIEQIDYDLALIDFVQGEFDSSNVALRRLMIDYPKGYFVNDALRLLMVMNEAEGDSSLLELYSSAETYKLRRMPDSTAEELKALTRTINRSLADNALFDLVNLSMNCGDTSAALGYIADLQDDFADSYYLPYGLKLKADILMVQSDRAAEAAEIYRSLLEKYSDYPFASEVRKVLRDMEAARPIG